MKKLILSNILRRRSQSVLTMAITALTVFTFVVVFGVFRTMDRGLAHSSERLGADCVIIPEEADASGYDLLFTATPENVYMPASVTEAVAKMDGVAAVSPQFYSQTLAGNCCSFGYEMRVVGIDQESDFILGPCMNVREYEGAFRDSEIVLGGEFTDWLGSTTAILGHRFTVVGELYPTGTGMDKTIFMDIDVARAITKEAEGLKDVTGGRDFSDQISVVMVRLREGVDAEKFARAVNRGNEYPIRCVAAGSTVTALQDQLSATMKVLFALWLASLLIAVLALFGRFNALAKDRKKEIGLMRAIGIQKSQIFCLIIGEACTMAFAGGVVGSAAACLAIRPALAALQKTFFLPPSVGDAGATLFSALAGVLLAVGLGFFAAVHSALKSASMEPQAAITEGELN